MILVVNFNGREHIARCIESIENADEPAGGIRIAVVDNASTDGSDGIVEGRFPAVELSRHQTNLGFTGGNNNALRALLETDVELVILLNMDTVVEAAALRELVAVADEDPSAALVGARILDPSGATIEFDGRQFDSLTTAGGYADRPVGDDDPRCYPAAYACGAGMLVRTEVLRAIGLFDESFFAYHEDVELSLRAWLCGYRVLHASRARIRHSQGAASRGTEFRDFIGLRNALLTIAKHSNREFWERAESALLGFVLSAPSGPNSDAMKRHRLKSALAATFELPHALEARRQLRPLRKRLYSELLDREPGLESPFDA